MAHKWNQHVTKEVIVTKEKIKSEEPLKQKKKASKKNKSNKALPMEISSCTFKANAVKTKNKI